MPLTPPKCPGFRYPPPDFSPNAFTATLGLLLGVLLSRVEGLLGIGSANVSSPANWLYIYVAAKTAVLPKENGVGINLKRNSEEYQDDRKACRKALEDVVRVLGDDGND